MPLEETLDFLMGAEADGHGETPPYRGIEAMAKCGGREGRNSRTSNDRTRTQEDPPLTFLKISR